ncbi:PHD finger protein 3 [Thoreauomyces humboldtii]|nr:PHD finger protein 3 [Thoreauomyces humboldtii]
MLTEPALAAVPQTHSGKLPASVTNLPTTSPGSLQLEDPFDQFVESSASSQSTSVVIPAEVQNIANLDAMDWDSFTGGTIASENAPLSWPADHGLLDDSAEFEPTDLFPSLGMTSSVPEFFESPKIEEEALNFEGPSGTSNNGEIVEDGVASDLVPSLSSSETPTANVSNTRRRKSVGNVAEVAQPMPLSPMARRPTREKAHVDYKSLLAGPSITRRMVPPKKPAFDEKGQRVYCLCRQPDSGKFMISCDNCEEWFHGACVGLTKKVGEKLNTFVCPPCKEILGLTSSPTTTTAASKSPASISQKPKRGPLESSSAVTAVPPATRAAPRSRASAASTAKGFFVDIPSKTSTPPVPCAGAGCSKLAKGSLGKFCSTACRDRPLQAEIVKCAHVPCLNASVAATSPFCGTDCARRYTIAQTVQQKPVTPVVVAPPPPPPVPAWQKEPARVNARKGFTTTFEAIFAEAKATPELYEGSLDKSINLDDAAAFVAGLEDAMYEAWATIKKGDAAGTLECAAPYKNKYRSLQFNLKDKDNLRLRRLVMCGEVTRAELVRLPAEDLANDEIKAAHEEARRKSLRDSIRIDEEPAVLVKKTHKGEVEIDTRMSVTGGMLHDEPISQTRSPKPWDEDGFASFRTVRSRTGSEESVLTGSPLARSPSIGDEHSLKSPDTLITDEKESAADRPSKRVKLYQNEAEEENSAVAMEGVEYASSPADEVQTMAENETKVEAVEAEDSEAPRTELVLEGDAAGDNYGYETYEYESNNDGAAAIVAPVQAVLDADAVVWQGQVRMQQVGRFTGSARQVGGRTIGGPAVWEDLLPATITIDGRMAPKVLHNYLSVQRVQGGKEIVVVEFLPAGVASSTVTPSTTPTSSPPPQSAGDTQNAETQGYASLFDYFVTRDRCAVVGHHYVSIKDMYFVPLAKDASIPLFMAEIPEVRIPDAPRPRDALYGVLILSKGYEGTPSARRPPRRASPQRKETVVLDVKAAPYASSAPSLLGSPASTLPVHPSIPPVLPTFTKAPPADPRAPRPPTLPTPVAAPSRPSLLDTLSARVGSGGASSAPAAAAPSSPANILAYLNNSGNPNLISDLLAQLNSNPAGGNLGAPAIASQPGIAVPAQTQPTLDIHKLLSMLGNNGLPQQHQQHQQQPAGLHASYSPGFPYQQQQLQQVPPPAAAAAAAVQQAADSRVHPSRRQQEPPAGGKRSRWD